MSALNACLKVAQIAEASSVPYLENVAKVAVVIFELLEQKGKNKEDAKELCENIANTIVVIDTLVRMQGERGAPYFTGICGEMEGYLQGVVQDLKDTKRKHHGIKGVFSVNEFRDAIHAYRKRVDDLKMDFLIHVTGDCLLGIMQTNILLKDVMAQALLRHSEEDFVIRIPKKTAAISALFSFRPRASITSHSCDWPVRDTCKALLCESCGFAQSEWPLIDLKYTVHAVIIVGQRGV